MLAKTIADVAPEAPTAEYVITSYSIHYTKLYDMAIIAGMLMMLLMATLFYLMGKLTESGNTKIESAIGKTGSVYLRIPAAKSGVGKIQINVQGLKTLDAMTTNTEDIKSGSLVKVVGIEAGDVLMVELL